MTDIDCNVLLFDDFLHNPPEISQNTSLISHQGVTLEQGLHCCNFLLLPEISEDENTAGFQDSVDLPHKLLEIAIAMATLDVHNHIDLQPLKFRYFIEFL